MKYELNFKIYHVIDWTANKYNTQLPNISRSKDNRAMKFGQLIEYYMRNFFFKNHAKNETGVLFLDLFFSAWTYNKKKL